jgi:hypothetical protein
MMSHQHFKGRDQPKGFRFTDPDRDLQTGVSQASNPGPRGVRCRVLATDKDTAKSGRDHRIHAGRGLPEMAARFKRHVQIVASCGCACCADGIDLGVSFPEFLMATDGDDSTIGRSNDGSHHRIWFDGSLAETGLFQGELHDCLRIGV